MSKGDTGRRRRDLFVVGFSVLGLLAVAALTLGVIVGLQYWDQQQAQDRRQAALQAARQTAVHLTSLSHKTAQQDVQRLTSSITGDFAQQFGSSADMFVEALTEAKVVSTGKVVEAGLVKIDEKSARVLLAVRSEVRNKAAPDGKRRDYRLAVTVQRQGEQWLASQVEFVP